ncbi:MAG TPA: type II toxin-antitoxin system HicB family antitoxin [Thermoleophilaceae bacterium]
MDTSSLAGSRYLELPYKIVLMRDKRKGSRPWLATVEELPGCEARGDSPEEATHALRDEMAAWMAGALEEGRSIPRPRNAPEAASARLTLNVPKTLREGLVQAAVREGLSLNQLITIALAGTIRWRPAAGDSNGRWIQARAENLINLDNPPRPGLRQALMLNAVLLGFVAVAALTVLIVALANGF